MTRSPILYWFDLAASTAVRRTFSGGSGEGGVPSDDGGTDVEPDAGDASIPDDGGSGENSPCDEPGETCCDPTPNDGPIYCNNGLVCLRTGECSYPADDQYVVCPEQAVMSGAA